MYLTLSIWFSDSEPLTFEKLASQTTATNSTIYIGKVKCDDLTLRSLFTRFGKIVSKCYSNRSIIQFDFFWGVFCRNGLCSFATCEVVRLAKIFISRLQSARFCLREACVWTTSSRQVGDMAHCMQYIWLKQIKMAEVLEVSEYKTTTNIVFFTVLALKNYHIFIQK